MNRHLRPASLLLAAACLAGCTPVEPWQRGNLARPQMSADYNAGQRALQQHVYSSREAGASAASSQGGGCGCY